MDWNNRIRNLHCRKNSGGGIMSSVSLNCDDAPVVTEILTPNGAVK